MQQWYTAFEVPGYPSRLRRTSSIAVRHALGADPLRGEVGPERAEEVGEGVHQYVEYDDCAEELEASGKVANADADQHSEGDQNGDENDGS